MNKELYNYIKEIKQYEILSDKEQKELMIKAKLENDQDAFLKVYHSNLLLVVKIAYKYYFPFLHLSIMDLIQEGNIALLVAMNNYDLKYIDVKKISSYVYRTIDRYMEVLTKNSGYIIRIPKHKFGELEQYKEKYDLLLKKLNRKPTIEELSKELNMTYKNVLTLSKLDLIRDVLSINLEINDEGEEIIDFIASKEEDFVEKMAKEQEENDIINYIFKYLTKTQATIINLRYGFDGEGYKGHKEVANILGYADRRNVESIERATLKKIKTKLQDWDYFNKIEK